MAKFFFGGVHPFDGKALSSHRAIEPIEAPAQVIIPMSQSIGAPCKPLVKKGDYVYMGQKIGDGEGLCVPVHASVSGTVAAVGLHMVAGGTTATCVTIDNDGQYTPDPSIAPRENADALDAQTLTGIIREAGIVGMGGAAFPTNAKISSALGKCDTIIVNAAECEPYITADDRLMRETPERLMRGVQILMKIFGLSAAHIGIEDNKKDAIASLNKAVVPGVQVHALRTRYPQGAEKQLIQAITGRQVPPGGLPAAVGCAVFNAATCAAIADAVDLGMPLFRRAVTVSGNAVVKPSNFLVPVGTPYAYLIEAAGGLKSDVYKIVSGGPMMGIAQFDLSVPTVKGCNAITCFVEAERSEAANPHCIRCGRCTEVCPMHLQPLLMYQNERKSNVAQLDALHVTDCIECGCCAYICPGRLPLVQSFKSGKTKVQQAAAEAKRLAAEKAAQAAAKGGATVG